MPAAQEFFCQFRHEDACRFKFVERGAQTVEIFWIGHDDQIGVAAKLRRAVKHARLAAHEQGPDAMLPDRRKDFDYRARDQVNLLRRSK